MDEEVLAAAVRRDEAEPLRPVEPLDLPLHPLSSHSFHLSSRANPNTELTKWRDPARLRYSQYKTQRPAGPRESLRTRTRLPGEDPEIGRPEIFHGGNQSIEMRKNERIRIREETRWGWGGWSTGQGGEGRQWNQFHCIQMGHVRLKACRFPRKPKAQREERKVCGLSSGAAT